MKWEIKVVADTNDADYVTSLSKISDKDLNKIRPVIAAIKAFKPYQSLVDGKPWTHTNNFPSGEYYPQENLGEKSVEELYGAVAGGGDALYLFQEYVPFGEHGIHTITSIAIAQPVQWKKLL